MRKNYCVSYPYQIHRSAYTGRGARKKMTEIRSIAVGAIAFGYTFM